MPVQVRPSVRPIHNRNSSKQVISLLLSEFTLEILYGIFPVKNCLKENRREIYRLWHKETVQNQQIAEIKDLASHLSVPIEKIGVALLEHKVSHANHQGVALLVGSLPRYELKNFLGKYSQVKKILGVDQIWDPQNLGALCRSAYFFGFDGLMLTKHRQAALSPSASKASAGWLESLPCITVINLVRSLRELKNHGFWIVGTDKTGMSPENISVLPEKLVLVMGNESRGTRKLTREVCDIILGISSPRIDIDSLNVSAAGAVLMNFLSGTGASK